MFYVNLFYNINVTFIIKNEYYKIAKGIMNMEKLPEKRDNTASSPKKQSKFKKYKTNTINSFNEIEYFLRNIKAISKGVKIYKLFK